ncbi:MAG: phosphoglucosamine mutase, partial [Candidatus Micrarchaeia archaeon]
MGLFGTSGIRGVFGTEVTPELALKVGYALGSRGSKVLVGRDTRQSGTILARALSAGALAAGADVIGLGIVSTPTLGHATAKFNCLGAMITASHNPPEYNGIKIFEKGCEAEIELEKEIEKSVIAGKQPAIDWRKLGSTSTYEQAIADHIAIALSQVDTSIIAKKKPKVLVDCGNGAASVISPFALQKAGCAVVGVNCEPSPLFSRKLEPNAENLADFSKMVKACGAQMGIAHDGDGDRAIILDERGELLGLDSQLALMC